MGLDVAQMTVAEAVDILDRGACSSEELSRLFLDRIKACDGEIGAFVYCDESSVLAQARAADSARAAGTRAPLLGVPIALKDNLNVIGQPCGCASRILAGYAAPYDATAVARLRAAGAVFLGRTNMDEFAMGSTTENSAIKETRNPLNHACVPGGSSGGSAAAVGGGMAPAAFGSDTGGSIRLPAVFCGCVGVKPTYGRVSRYGLVAFASSLDQIGPIAKTVADAALLTETICGLDAMDSTTVARPAPRRAAARRDDLRGVKIGLPREYFVGGLDAGVARAVDKAVAVCRGLGAETVEISLPHTDYAIAAYYVIATAEASANLARFDGVRYGLRAPGGEDMFDLHSKTRAAGFGPEVKRRIILGTYVLSSGYYDAYYLSAQKVRTLIRRDFDEAFRLCDAIVTPVSPSPPWKIGAKTGDPLQMYLSDVFTVTANLAGIPGVALPCGLVGENVPAGVQILGPAFDEENIFAVADAYERARGPLAAV
jgi:aspartyl-tRNA(Asn)/glutamyl-tRNA(Gln) amidotransferase subunit A